jgi:hypothetical protein
VSGVISTMNQSGNKTSSSGAQVMFYNYNGNPVQEFFKEKAIKFYFASSHITTHLNDNHKGIIH